MATAISNDEMQVLWRIAEAMHASGDYKDLATPAQAFNRIMIGRDLGLSPAQAMMGIDLVRGNLQIRAVLLASFVRQSREYDYKVLKHDERECTLEFYRLLPSWSWSDGTEREGAELLGESTFTIEDAAHAKLIRTGSPWETVPRNMVFARAMSNGVKWYCPDLLGGVPVYTEGDDLRSEAAAIGESEGDAEPGWKGVSVPDAAEVEKVIRRAGRLGHKGLAHRASIQMALNDQPPEAVAQWIGNATLALDEIASRNTEPDPEPVVGAQGYAVPEGLSDEDRAAAARVEESWERIEPKLREMDAKHREDADEPIPGQTPLTEPEGE